MEISFWLRVLRSEGWSQYEKSSGNEKLCMFPYRDCDRHRVLISSEVQIRIDKHTKSGGASAVERTGVR